MNLKKVPASEVKQRRVAGEEERVLRVEGGEHYYVLGSFIGFIKETE